MLNGSQPSRGAHHPANLLTPNLTTTDYSLSSSTPTSESHCDDPQHVGQLQSADLSCTFAMECARTPRARARAVGGVCARAYRVSFGIRLWDGDALQP